LISELRSRPELGIRVVQHLQELDGTPNCKPCEAQPFGLAELEEIVRANRVERVMVALGDCRGKLPVAALLQLKSRGVRVEDAAEVYEATTGKFSVESMRLSSLLFSPGFSVSRPLLIYKRIFSFLVSLIGLIAAAPLMGLTVLVIRLDSTGPVIFKQKRVGKDGKIFTVFKFRTMTDGADRDENHLPAQNRDGRFTRVGRWLRRARLDELPQLFNILRCDMDLIGPRPFVPNQEQECVEKIPFYRQRWAVKPGLTGWAQINRGYCATVEDNAEKLAYDLFYIKNISPGLDILILFKTIKLLLLGRGSR
jgi:exopolysaccharide biosynthesis polyprenyl glycosylphosphotransferase